MLQQPAQLQLGLQLFAEMNGAPITDIRRDLKLKKANHIISLRTSGFGLLGRKMLNAMLFIARDTVLEEEQHIVDVDYFKWLCNYDSNNHAYLKREGKKVRAHASFDIDFLDSATPDSEGGAVGIINDFLIRNGKVYFTINKNAREAIARPDRWTWLSMRISTSFTSEYALILYEQMSADKQFRTYTDWKTVEEFRADTGTTNLYDGYKALRRYVINTALTQIKENSDIIPTLETKTVGRTVTHIRFKLEDNPNGTYAISLPKKATLGEAVYTVLSDEFKITSSELDRLITEYSVDYLMEKIDYVRSKMKKGEVKKNPAGLLIWALRENARLTLIENKPDPVVEEKKAAADAIKKKEEATKTKEAQINKSVTTELEGLNAEQTEQLLNEFAQSDIFQRLTCVRKNLDPKDTSNRWVAGALRQFMSERLQRTV